MLGVLLLAVAPTQPTPTPLKTISHIHASPFCTALRENIGHAVRSLIDNDVAVDSGKSMFLQMAQDRVYRANPALVLDTDMERMSSVITKMVDNLAAVDAALNDLKAIPNQPKSDDERRLAQMRDDLRAVADQQREALNVFSGTYYSYKSNELNEKKNPIAGAVAANPNSGAAPATDAVAPIVIPPIKSAPAPVQSASPAPSPAPKSGSLVDMGLAGYTPYAGLFNSLTTIQLREQPLESHAAQTILQYTDECK